MKTIIALSIAGVTSLIVPAQTPSDTTDAFHYDPAKVETHKAYFYLKSNIDGTRPSNVAPTASVACSSPSTASRAALL